LKHWFNSFLKYCEKMDYLPIFEDARNELCMVVRDGEVAHLSTAGTPAAISIGRTAPCELVISDEDLGSSNGTFIGEFQAERKLTAPAAIMGGEIFRVGLARLRLGGAKNGRVAAAGAVAGSNVGHKETSMHETPNVIGKLAHPYQANFTIFSLPQFRTLRCAKVLAALNLL
jgi:hypothetical protein